MFNWLNVLNDLTRIQTGSSAPWRAPFFCDWLRMWNLTSLSGWWAEAWLWDSLSVLTLANINDSYSMPPVTTRGSVSCFSHFSEPVSSPDHSLLACIRIDPVVWKVPHYCGSTPTTSVSSFSRPYRSVLSSCRLNPIVWTSFNPGS